MKPSSAGAVVAAIAVDVRAHHSSNLFKRVAQNVFYGNISTKFDCFMSF